MLLLGIQEEFCSSISPKFSQWVSCFSNISLDSHRLTWLSSLLKHHWPSLLMSLWLIPVTLLDTNSQGCFNNPIFSIDLDVYWSFMEWMMKMYFILTPPFFSMPSFFMVNLTVSNCLQENDMVLETLHHQTTVMLLFLPISLNAFKKNKLDYSNSVFLQDWYNFIGSLPLKKKHLCKLKSQI